MKGITSNASPTDINDESATYSLNINSNNILGRLEGINTDAILTNIGFQSLDDGEISATEMTLDFSNIFDNYGDGLSTLAEQANSFGMIKSFDIDRLLLQGETPASDPTNPSLEDSSTFIFHTDTSNEHRPVASPKAYTTFDDLGTLQTLILADNGTLDQYIGTIYKDMGAFPIRPNGAGISGYATSSDFDANRPVYGFNPIFENAY